MENNRGFKGVWIPKELYLSSELSRSEKDLIVEIDSLDKGDGCWASNEYLAEFLDIKEGTLKNTITKLRKMGILYDRGFDGRKRYISVNPEVIKKLPQRSQKNDPWGHKKMTPEIEKIPENPLIEPYNSDEESPSNTYSNTIINPILKNRGISSEETREVALDDFGMPRPATHKRQATKPSDLAFFNDLSAIWQKMVSAKLKIPIENVPVDKFYFVAKACHKREKWTREQFIEMFKYFLNDPELKPENKFSISLCLSQDYVTKYKVHLKNIPLLDCVVSSMIKL